MGLADVPIKKKLLRAILLTSASVLAITCSAYFAYEVFTFRQTTVNQLSIIGDIISDNSTAALAFSSNLDAQEVLASLRAHKYIEAAGIYDHEGKLFAHYPDKLSEGSLPDSVTIDGYSIIDSYIIGTQPIIQKSNVLGTLYLKSNTNAITERLQSYGAIALIVIVISFLGAYVISKKMQSVITDPIRELADTARSISERKDYSVRANKYGNDEVGMLTMAFNQMLDEIHAQDKEIKSFNTELGNRIKERTMELEVANKELESFSYSVSHDLRAPLRSVVGYSKIMLEDYIDKLDSEGVRVLNVIVSNAQKMGNLIDDLLAFSKIGKQNVTRVPLNMKSITEEVVREFNNEVTGVIEIQEMLESEGDKSMIKQVITNLVSNAIKYSGKEEKQHIEIGSYCQNNSHIYFVKDNGAGFDMQYYHKLFGVFERLHSQKDFEGTGVGLALVNRIISKHDGKVWAEGKINEGATFYFSLPINLN